MHPDVSTLELAVIMLTWGVFVRSDLAVKILSSILILLILPPLQASMILNPHGVRVLRCQLPRRNPYYAASPAPDSQIFPDRPREAPSHADPWGCTQHDLSKGASDSGQPTPFLYPEAELVVEEEASSSMDPEKQAQELQKLLNKTKLKQQVQGDCASLIVDCLNSCNDQMSVWRHGQIIE